MTGFTWKQHGRSIMKKVEADCRNALTKVIHYVKIDHDISMCVINQLWLVFFLLTLPNTCYRVYLKRYLKLRYIGRLLPIVRMNKCIFISHEPRNLNNWQKLMYLCVWRPLVEQIWNSISLKFHSTMQIYRNCQPNFVLTYVN